MSFDEFSRYYLDNLDALSATLQEFTWNSLSARIV